jgi:DNA polymerase III delta subunit
MLFLYTGTDTETAREKLNAAVEKASKKSAVVRITDAHTLADLAAALQGGGMFGGERTIVLDNVLLNTEMEAYVMERLDLLKKSTESIYMYEAAPLAAVRKQLEKYAEKSERFDAEKGSKKDNSIFALANALQSGKKKELWVGYQREIASGKAPEAIHGALFWGAKQLLLRSQTPRARALVAQLAELPHEARRRGFELEYALEHFVLSVR